MADGLTRRRLSGPACVRPNLHPDWSGNAPITTDTLKHFLWLFCNLLIKLVRKHIERAGFNPIQRTAVGFRSEGNELLWFVHRKRLKQEPMNQREDRGVRADPQPQRKNCNRSEAGALAQLPQRVTNVLEQSRHA